MAGLDFRYHHTLLYDAEKEEVVDEIHGIGEFLDVAREISQKKPCIDFVLAKEEFLSKNSLDELCNQPALLSFRKSPTEKTKKQEGTASEYFSLDNRYEIIRKIGEGGFGCVYEAFDHRLENRVAIKELKQNFKYEHQRESIEKKFKREAQALSRLNHPGLPTVIDFFVDSNNTGDDAFFLVMTYIDGHSLEKVIENRALSPFSFQEVYELSRQILEILDYLHTQEPPIIFRDLKPSNMMVRNDGKLFLIDFGLIKLLNEDIKFGSIAGTVEFSAPEQFRGKVGPYSDIFSLGVTLFYLLTNRIPDYENLAIEFERLKQDHREIPQQFIDLLASMLSNDILERPKSARFILDNYFAGNEPQNQELELSKKLFLAIEREDLASIKELIAQGASPKSRNELGWTALDIAVTKGFVESIDTFTINGWDVNSKGPDGWTPLHLAAYYNKIICAKILLLHGADIEAAKADGANPITIAIHNQNKQMLNLFIIEGADLNYKGYEGKALLHLAIIQGKYNLVESLILGGAKTDIRTIDGFSPIDLANELGHLEIAELIGKSELPDDETQNFSIKWNDIKYFARGIFDIRAGEGGKKWAKTAWHYMEQAGLADYKNPLERQIVYLRLLTLATIYGEFQMLAFNEMFYFSENFWDSIDDRSFIDPELIKQLVNEPEFQKFDFNDYKNHSELVEALEKIIDNFRREIFIILENRFGWPNLFLSLYLTRFLKEDGTEYDYENITDEDMKSVGIPADDDRFVDFTVGNRSYYYVQLGFPSSPLDSF